MKNILVHTCCGPCFAGTYPLLSKQYSKYEITSYYFNPNIHPSLEYVRRLEALSQFCDHIGIELNVGEYDPRVYFKEITGNEGDRCMKCYTVRLGGAARFAAEGDYCAFTTTLLVSPYQKHDAIKAVGKDRKSVV